jgi:predicted ArsR family transcriptional regulator
MDPLEAVGVPELREALLFVRSRRRAVSADDLAAAQSVHRNVARSRLARLAAAGLLVCRSERRSGRTGPGAGRPAKVYSPAPETSAIELPERRYEELVGLLAAELPEQRLDATGAELARRLVQVQPARDLREGLERACEALGRLGYQACVEEADDRRAVVFTPTCPLRPLVVAHPEAAGIDRGFWRGLAEASVEGARVTCQASDCLDPAASCRIVLELRPQSIVS